MCPQTCLEFWGFWVQYPYVDSVHYMIVCIFDVKHQECRPAVVFDRYGAVISIRHGMDRNTPMKCLRIQDRWRKQKREKKGVVWKSLGRDIEWVFPFMVACFGSISLPPENERVVLVTRSIRTKGSFLLSITFFLTSLRVGMHLY